MQTLGSVAAVVAAVREDAAVEAERVARAAAAEVERIAAEPIVVTDEVRAVKLAAARREARERLAHEDTLDSRAAIEARETWMREIVDEAHRRLASCEATVERRARLTRIVSAARLPGDRFVVRVAPSDQPILDGASADASLLPGGVRISTEDGRLTVDESIEARARRWEAAWRAALGRIWG